MIKSVNEYSLLVDEDLKAARWAEASEELWQRILQEAPSLKNEVALNKMLPNEILDFLSSDNNEDIRYKIAQKRRLPLGIFLRLAFDKDDSVRMAIARNPKTPTNILEKMRLDSWDEIVSVVNKRLAK